MNHLHSANNFYYFTSSLILLALVSALVDSFAGDIAGHRLLQAVILLVQIVAYFSLNLSRRWRQFVLVILGLLLLTNLLREASIWTAAPIASLFASLAFFCGMTYAAARQVLFNRRIDWNTIVGTVAVFLLLGVTWSLVYLITLEYWHEGFNGIQYRNWNENFGVMSYFSFVTMTTLGYGDISPAVPLTRTLVYLQAICGTFYMAVVVASLVSARNNFSK